jgi:uncharacterized LabA/DUF88 family protein
VGKNVAVFVDVANIFYAAKAAGVDIDYVTLLKAGSAGRDLVRAYAYTGLDPDNENQRNFHDFLRRNGYRVVSKDIRKYGDGKVKANLDIELVIDMMKTARNLDVAIVVSGDGDFAPAIRAVQEMGVRVEVVSFRGNTSSDLMDVADQFTDITQIAKVEKGSVRSGRRVAGDEQDLSMTEVPEKQSEGTGERGRGRGRTRRTPVAATAVSATASSGRGRPRVAAADAGVAPLVVLPGEKLSGAAAATSPLELADAGIDEPIEEFEAGEAIPVGAGTDEERLEDGRRRRRRRGGRGRGRGRREEGTYAERSEPGAAEAEPDELEDEEAPAPARRPASTFGSVWDSQIGISASASRGAPLVDEEDFEEPSVPEYLLTERRQRSGGGGQGRGIRGGRGGAYAAAVERERYGGGRGSTPSRFQEPSPRGRDAGHGDRDFRRGGDRPPFRPAPRPAPRPSGDEPWSEVPPEIEAMLRAQQGSRPAGDVRREPASNRERGAPVDQPAATSSRSASETPAVEAGTPPAGRATRAAGRTTARAGAQGATRSRRATADAVTSSIDVASSVEGAASVDDAAASATKPPTRATASRARSTRTSKAAAPAVAGDEPAEAPAKAKTRKSTARGGATTRSRSQAESAVPAPDAGGDSPAAAEAADAAPKRRSPRKKAEPTA